MVRDNILNHIGIREQRGREEKRGLKEGSCRALACRRLHVPKGLSRIGLGKERDGLVVGRFWLYYFDTV